ncbi:MAG TPA: hypothetical protein VK943_05595, partial [Arenibaculum sp.]|nr:hypothetical protein [Arenibaculum sp.]
PLAKPGIAIGSIFVVTLVMGDFITVRLMSGGQSARHVVLPVILPSIIGVALFGFTLFYDEFARTLMTAGSFNTLPLEIYGMTTNVTTPVLYALGTLTTAFSFTVIGLCLAGFAAVQRRASRPRAGTAG